MDSDDGSQAVLLLDRAAAGDVDAWGTLLARHQERLAAVASSRLDPRLRGRFDAADVIQEVFIAATSRRAEFFQQSTQSLYLWLRWMVGNMLLELHRHHLGAQMRDPKREVSGGRAGRRRPGRHDSRRAGGRVHRRRHGAGDGGGTRGRLGKTQPGAGAHGRD
jgi:hypothetical protein